LSPLNENGIGFEPGAGCPPPVITGGAGEATGEPPEQATTSSRMATDPFRISIYVLPRVAGFIYVCWNRAQRTLERPAASRSSPTARGPHTRLVHAAGRPISPGVLGGPRPGRHP